MPTNQELDALYTELILNDPVMQDLARRRRGLIFQRGDLAAPEGGWLSGENLVSARNARLMELGIDPNEWKLSISFRGDGGYGQYTGVDHQNWWERNEDTILKVGALGVFGLVAGGAVAGVVGGGAGGTTAAATTTTAATTAGGAWSIANKVLLGLGLAGTALDVFGNLQAGKAAKEVAEFNARVADMQAGDALERGAEDEARFRQQIDILVGSQRAGFAGQNVVVDYGSAAHVVTDARYLGEQDAKQIRRNAEREAWGHRMNAEGYRLGGQHAVVASRFNASGSVLSGATSVIGARYGFGA